MNPSTVTDAIPADTTVVVHRSDDDPSLQTQISDILWKVWPPFILLLGFFGNTATIFVMRRMKDKHSSQHIILMALAASDITLLYVSVLRQWVFHVFHVDMYNLHTVLCKLSTWLVYAASTTSSWLLTCVTVQRTMAVTWPHKMRMVCTTQRTCIAVLAIVCFGGLLHSHFLYGMSIPRDKCTFTTQEYEKVASGLWAWVDLAVFSLLPTVCLLVCDVILSMTLFKATATASESVQTITSASSAHISSTRRKTASRTTVMILTLSCTFLLLTMPVCVYLIWDFYQWNIALADTGTTTAPPEINTTLPPPVDTRTPTLSQEESSSPIPQDPSLWVFDSLGFTVTLLLWNTNSAVNFLLYCFTGTKFKREFLNWITCGAQASAK